MHWLVKEFGIPAGLFNLEISTLKCKLKVYTRLMVTKAFFSVKQTIFHSFLDRSLEVLTASHKDNHEKDDHNHHHKHFNTKVSIKEGVSTLNGCCTPSEILKWQSRFSLKSRLSEGFHRPEMSQIKAEISLRTNVKLIFHKNVGWQGYQWIP